MNDLLQYTGVHPHDAKTWTDDCYEVIKELASNPECVAVGECGLDFNRNFSPPDVQMEVFEKQVQLACEVGKPLFLHERDAHDDMVRILGKFKDRLPPAVLHCFTGTSAQAVKYLEMGLYIGLTGSASNATGVERVNSQFIFLVRFLVERQVGRWSSLHSGERTDPPWPIAHWNRRALYVSECSWIENPS